MYICKNALVYDEGETPNEAFENLCDQIGESLNPADCVFYKMISVTIGWNIKEFPEETIL